jgi:hypothetical protein
MLPQEWLNSLDTNDRNRAGRMIALLERFGADNPASWVRSEMQENIPQVACFLFLHEIRSQIVNQFRYDGSPEPDAPALHPSEIETKGDEAYQRLLDAGASQDDLEAVAHSAACRTVWEFISRLDGVLGSEYNDIEDAPRWALAEVTGPLGEAELTGRCLDSLHESYGSLYPTDP